MAKRIAIPFALVLIAGLVLGIVPYLTQKREVTALTPAVPPLPPGSLVPAGIKSGSELCVRDLPLSPDGQVARVITSTGGKPGPQITVTAQGPGYDARTTVRAGWKEGTLEVPLRPPAHSERGTLCFRNAGHAPFALMASGVGEKLARPTPYLDAQPLQQDVPLVFHKARPASMLSRTGALVDHAAVFSPLPAWLIWMVLLAALCLIPVLTIGAVVMGNRRGEEGAISAPAPPVPFRGAARRLGAQLRSARGQARRVPVWVVVVALVLVATAFLLVWADRTTTFQPDEEQNVYFARWVANNLPSALWDFHMLERGLQRLEIWVLALGLGSLRSPEAFRFVHLVNAGAYASALVPAFLMARTAGASRAYALAAGVLAVALPWAIVTTSFLTEPLSYPAFVWTVWATTRAVLRPRAANDLVALAVLAVALLTRSAFLILVPLLPLAVVLQELRVGPRKPAQLTRRIVRTHPVVVGAVALGLVGLLASAVGILPPLGKLAGSYGTPFSLSWGPFLHKVEYWSSRLVVGGGFAAFALGLPWLVHELIRPVDRASHGVALVGALAIVLLLYASNPAGTDERYIMYFAPILAVGAVVALERLQLRWPWVAAGGLLAAWLVHHEGWNPVGGPAEFFVAPAESFYARVGLLRLAQYVPTWISVNTAALVIALAVTAVLAFVLWRRARLLAAAVLALLVLLQLGQTDYALTKYVDGAGGRFQATLEQRAWLDQSLAGKHGDAAFLATGVGNTGDYNYVWSLLEFWNSRDTGQYGFGPTGVSTTPGDYAGSITANPVTGRAKATPPLPPWMVLPRDYVQVELAGELIVRPLYNGLDLWRIRKPGQLVFGVSHAGQRGEVTEDQPATIRFYAAAQPPGTPRCAQIPIGAAPASSGPSPAVPYRIGPKHGVIPSAAQINVQVPLDFHGKPYLDVPVKVRGKIPTATGTYAARLLIITTGRCTRS